MEKVRAKMYVESVKLIGTQEYPMEEVQLRAVGGNKVQRGYPKSGLDEDNTYAKASPSADFRITVANEAVHGFFKRGQKFYIDMIPAEE